VSSLKLRIWRLIAVCPGETRGSLATGITADAKARATRSFSVMSGRSARNLLADEAVHTMSSDQGSALALMWDTKA